MFVIHFRKGMAYPFFPLPMSEMSDRVVDADLLWGNAFALLREQLCGIKQIDLKFHAVESFLLKHFHGKFMLNPAVDYALAEILRRPDQINLRHISNKIGYSPKHFIDIFRQQVGITPKSYLKIIRFQKAISEIEERKKANWTNISQDCGFYDQAHFIKEFKAFSGFTPKEFYEKENVFFPEI